MITVRELIHELEKIENKDVEICVRTGIEIRSISNDENGCIFECDADGVPFVSMDC